MSPQDDRRVYEIAIEMPVDIPRRSLLDQRRYPLFALRVPVETHEKRLRLESLGVDIPNLVKPLLDQIFDEALKQLEEGTESKVS